MKNLLPALTAMLVVTLALAGCGAGETAGPADEQSTGGPAKTEATPKIASPTPREPASTGEDVVAGKTPAAELPEDSNNTTAAVRTFVIVPQQSKASYIVAEEFFSGALDRLGIEPGLVDTVGSTQDVNGQMQLDFGNPASPLVSNRFTVNLRSLTSDQSRRDQRIRTNNLESEKYPLAEFTITTLTGLPEAYTEGDTVTFKAQGDITIRDITQPATFDVTAKLQGQTITGMAVTRLKMTDFGVDPPNFANMFSVEDEFTVRVEFTFNEQ